MMLLVEEHDRVLVVDDDEAFAELTARKLRLAGFVVSHVTSAAEALDVAAELQPHVAVIDLHLGTENGHELGLRLRAASPRDLQLIMLTADERPYHQDRSDELGFAAHLIKPVSLRDLARMIAVLRFRVQRDVDTP